MLKEQMGRHLCKHSNQEDDCPLWLRPHGTLTKCRYGGHHHHCHRHHHHHHIANQSGNGFCRQSDNITWSHEKQLGFLSQIFHVTNKKYVIFNPILAYIYAKRLKRFCLKHSILIILYKSVTAGLMHWSILMFFFFK